MRVSSVQHFHPNTFSLRPQVWSPSGAYWNHAPPNWQRNTGLAFGFVCLCIVGMFKLSSELEHRPIPPYRVVPSQYRAKHGAAEDPRVAK